MGLEYLFKRLQNMFWPIPKYSRSVFLPSSQPILSYSSRFLSVVFFVALAACDSESFDKSRLYSDGVVDRQRVVSNPGVPGKEVGCQSSSKAPSQLHSASVERSYRVGPGDNLKFNIFGETGLTDIVARVDGGGYVQLPIVETVKVAGRTTREIQQDVKQSYSDHFNNPWVTVELVHAESHPLYFLGEFNSSGVQYLEHPRTLLESLALGGGLTQDAYLPGARLIRNNTMCIVDLHGLLKEGRFEHNIQITGGDVIFAPRKEDMQVYVLGAVGSPQALPFGAQGRTILEALTMAEGPDGNKALLDEVRIIRSYSTTEGELLVVNVDKMLKGQALDYPLAPGDVVYVPQDSVGEWNDVIEMILPTLEVIGGIVTPIVLVKSL
ncbi:polysaccharide export protein Wza [Shimia thalassica]|uniref:Polysaccharide export protein Wza n=1 Tax=Shimia thalassica TaxID=1715693 RepID=A0A0P1IBC3_9RHOB|nr:polysaccharide export protein Wza [Shimia thalassica]